MHPRLEFLEQKKQSLKDKKEGEVLTPEKISQKMKALDKKSFSRFHQTHQRNQSLWKEQIEDLTKEVVWAQKVDIPLNNLLNDLNERNVLKATQLLVFCKALHELLLSCKGQTNAQSVSNRIKALDHIVKNTGSDFEENLHYPLYAERKNRAMELLQFKPVPQVNPQELNSTYLTKIRQWCTHQINHIDLAKAFLSGDGIAIETAMAGNTYYPRKAEELANQIQDMTQSGEYESQMWANKALSEQQELIHSTTSIEKRISIRRI